MPREIARYLARMDLFKACGIRYDENFVRHNRAGDLVELCMLDKRANIDDCAARMAHALVGSIPGLDPRAKLDEMTGFSPYNLLYVPLVYILNEFLENALTHGRRGGFKDAVAWIAAQYYAAKDRICLAVIDDGCGFLGSLRKHQDLHDKTHLGATRLALLPRVTCNPDLELRSSETANQGIGLTIIKEMTNRSRGVIRMGSGDHVLELSGGGAERPYRITDWQGVILALEFKRDLLRQVNVHQVIKALRDLPSPQGLRFE